MFVYFHNKRQDDIANRWKAELSAHLHTLQRTNTENSKQIFPENEVRGHSPNFHIHVSVTDLYIPTIDLPILLKEISGPILEFLTDINVEIGTETVQSQKGNS